MPADYLGSVLFACTYNAVRSPMAAAILRHMHGRRIFVDSVGVRPAGLDPMVMAVMEEVGIDLTGHEPKTFETLEDGNFDLVISLSAEAQHRAVELTRSSACQLEFWPVLDPTLIEGSRAARLDTFRVAREELTRRIRRRFGAVPIPVI